MGLTVTNEKDKTILTISGSFTKTEEGKPITFTEVELSKNTILINLKDIDMYASDDTLSNKDGVKLIKARIDFGDGESKLFSKSLKVEKSTIFKVFTGWNEIEHFINSDETVKSSKLTITLYNTFGDIATLIIPYILKSPFLNEFGTEFDLINANLRNDKKASLILRHRGTDSIISVFENDSSQEEELGNDVVDAT